MLMRNSDLPKKQRGAVLIFALLVLLVMTVLGVSGVGNSVLQERMAGNYQQSHTSFQSAELALRVAEDWVATNVTSANINIQFLTGRPERGLYSQMSGVDADKVCQGNAACSFDPRALASWNNGAVLQNGFVTLGSNDLLTGNLPAVADSPAGFQPRFVVEYMGQYSEIESTSNDGGADGYQKNPFATGSLHVVKVTAIGWGGNQNVRTVLQSNYHFPLL